MIAGIVLAGGRSERMGRPKALLRMGKRTFLEQCVSVLRTGGCEEVVVVLNTKDPTITRLATGAGAQTVSGAGESSQQIDSLRAGLRALSSEAEAAIVLPVDHPLVEPDTVTSLIGIFREGNAPIVRAAYHGQSGHPVLFSRDIFADLLEGHQPEGARSVLRRYAGALKNVEVNDAGVVADIDTPDDFEEYIGEVL